MPSDSRAAGAAGRRLIGDLNFSLDAKRLASAIGEKIQACAAEAATAWVVADCELLVLKWLPPLPAVSLLLPVKFARKPPPPPRPHSACAQETATAAVAGLRVPPRRWRRSHSRRCAGDRDGDARCRARKRGAVQQRWRHCAITPRGPAALCYYTACFRRRHCAITGTVLLHRVLQVEDWRRETRKDSVALNLIPGGGGSFCNYVSIHVGMCGR